MTTRYIHSTGSDTTGDGTYALPYATLAKAISVSATGDTILFKTGTFTVSANTSSNVSKSTPAPGKNLTIGSETGDPRDVIIQGLLGTEAYNISSRCSSGGYAGPWKVENLTFKNLKGTSTLYVDGTATSTGASIIGCGGTGDASQLTVNNCRFLNINLNTGNLIGHADNHSPVGDGVSWYLTLTNNVFCCYGTAYICRSSNGTGIKRRMYNNVWHLKTGVTKHTSFLATGNCDLRNNIFKNDQTAMTTIVNSSPIAFTYNTFDGDTLVAGTGNVSRSALFVSPNTYDYHLRQTSPEIGTGVAI